MLNLEIRKEELPVPLQIIGNSETSGTPAPIVTTSVAPVVTISAAPAVETTTTPTAVKTTIAYTADPIPSETPTQPSGTFNLLIIIGFILLLCIGGGGYYILHSRKTKPQRLPATGMQSSPSEQAANSPNLVLTIEKTQLVVDKWYRLPVHITNTGTIHAVDVSFTFSDEFETKWIKPATIIESGASTDVIIGLRPKHDGSIPLEIRVQYKDVQKKEYKQTFEYWIEVLDSLPLAAHAQPPSLFTPKPLTSKQLPPDLAERYTESEFIGKGGFARVFKAKRKDGQFVAVKIPISLDESTGKSFIAELQNWTRLDHPNIVKVYNFNIMPMPYFEEELCDSALADQNKPIECEEAAWIIFNICEGLKFAHTRKIIHRDLKPQNILLKNGVPKISDWGLSRIISESTTTSATSFTPYYAAPEQIVNKVKDERTDIWQLGVILYELVTGVLPFTGDSMVEIGMNIATKDPKRLGEIIPDAYMIDTVVMKCLQKDPAKRYPSVLELQKDLALYLRENYTELLKTSVSVHDYNRSAYYCGDLVMINMLTGDMKSAYKYLLDLIHYSKGDVKAEAQELSEQIKMRMEMGVTEIPDELIQKAEIIVHHVSRGFKMRV
jgi:serine/threonine protein kinase